MTPALGPPAITELRGFPCCKPLDDDRINVNGSRLRTLRPWPAQAAARPEPENSLSPERAVLTGGKPDEERYSCQSVRRACSRACLCSSGRAEGPITSISGKMTNVAGDLAKTVTGEPVQTRQKEIVKDLDDLIASLEKQCQNCKNGMVKNNPTRPATQSTIRRGTGGIGELVNPEEGHKDWAKISPQRTGPHHPVHVRRLPARIPAGPRALLPPTGRGKDGRDAEPSAPKTDVRQPRPTASELEDLRCSARFCS